MGKTVQVNFQIDRQLLEKAKKVAEIHGYSLSHMIREGLKMQMDDYDDVLDAIKNKDERKIELLEKLFDDIREKLLV